jgi:vanillate/3-O-methylgallate O-demethylase
VAINVNDLRKTPEGYFTSRWGLPEYTDWMDESMSWKENCYIGDWSFVWDRRIKGPGAVKLFSDISTASFEKFDIGQSKHLINCNENGKVIHNGILSRLSEDELMLQGRNGFWADYKLRHGKYNATLQADDLAKFQVSGPNSIHVIEKACGESIRDIQFMHFRKLRIEGLDVIALRQGMAGEVGYEIQAPIKRHRELYDAILKAGKEFGMRRLGGRAVFINHLEACFPTVIIDYIPAFMSDDMLDYFNEFKAAMRSFETVNQIAGSFEGKDISDYYKSPIELGWSNVVKFDHEFIGRKALEEEMAHPKRTMRTLVWNAEDVVEVYASLYRKGQPYHFMDMPRDQRGFHWADKVMKDGKLVGVTTSRGYSYYFRQMLSLCPINIDCSKPGTEVTIIWGNPDEPQKEIRATVAPAPYKEDKRRIDVSKL